jgi:hypothetical protein
MGRAQAKDFVLMETPPISIFSFVDFHKSEDISVFLVPIDT